VETPALAATGALAPPTPSEQPFRYDGPLPQFKESAIISLADGIEAATRSLRQVNAEELKETINRVVSDRITHGQLDEAPLTLDEITRIKNSFHFTLLNMLHSRVAYPLAENSPTSGSS
jgi:membrane-associated HD superfamily phosphohydrolase